MLDQEYTKQLTQGIDQLGLDLSVDKINRLLDYIKLLSHWNKAYNLTAVRSLSAMIDKHILDSLSVVPFFAEHKSIIDIGSGPGLPGIVLAICYPNTTVTVVDSNGKKTRFMQHAASHLQLPNVTVINQRAENIDSEQQYSTVTSRAFSSLADMLEKTAHLLLPGGRFLAMKGVYPTEELSELPQGFKVCAVHEVQVPGLAAQRHLIAIEKS